jgi:LPXTG-site transpeptidase (sortase) family protein
VTRSSFSHLLTRCVARPSLSRVVLWSGGLLVVLSVDILAVSALRTWQHQVTASAADVVSSGERLAAVAELSATAPTSSVSGVEPTATPTPEPAPSYGPALWVTIPRIKVDERVMEVGVENGEYVAPAWDVGHQEDSVNPGEPGNSVFNGHLTTINAGHVFARLHELRPGDVIYVFTESHRLTWTVEQVYTTDNDDGSFMTPTDDTRITLYTCDGQLLPLQHDYSQRFVVVGRLEEARARDGESAASGTEDG